MSEEPSILSVRLRSALAAIVVVACGASGLVFPHRAALAEDDALRDRKILAELEINSSIDCQFMPLSDILAYASDLHDIPIEIDTATLKQAGVNYAPMTFSLKRKDEPLYDWLLELLSQNKLSFMIKDHKLLVTTPEAAKQWHASHFRGRKP